MTFFLALPGFFRKTSYSSNRRLGYRAAQRAEKRSTARIALAAALASNPHVPAYLLGHKPLPRVLPAYTGLGDEREAMSLAVENIQAWQTTEGALAWLVQRMDGDKPRLLH